MLRILDNVRVTPGRVLAAATLCVVAVVVAALAWWPGALAPGAGQPAERVGVVAPAPAPAATTRSAGWAAPDAPAAWADPAARPVAPPVPSRAARRVSVRSILVGPDRRLAVVDGRIVGPGDRVAGAVVVDIRPREVELRETGGGRRTIALARPAPAARVR